MRVIIGDLPTTENISRVRASGRVTAASTEVSLTVDGKEFVVPVTHRRFPNGGSWTFYRCKCDRSARKLRLLNGSLICRFCCDEAGARHKVYTLDNKDRRLTRDTEKMAARLASTENERLRPVNGVNIDRRRSLEASLREALIRKRETALRKAIKRRPAT